MRYLYGDSTAFPINQNFVETAAAATETAVCLLRVDEILVRARKVADDANVAAMKELADIDQLSQRVDASLAQRQHLSNATAKVAEGVLQTSKAQFDRARQGIRAWRDATVKKSLQGTGAAAVMEPIHRFVVRHELPYTTWGLRWRAGRANESVQAQVYAIMQRGLTASVAVAIPPQHMWAEPVRVQRLERGLSIKMMGQNWLGHERLLDESLDKYFITRVTRTTERETLVLSKKPQEDAPGLKVSLREGDNRRVTLARVDENDTVVGDTITLNGQDGEVMRRLWSQVKSTIGSLVACRSHLLAATLYGKAVHELDSPAPVAVAFIQSVAPLIREMQRHSRTPGELQLKRDLGDGRREELFLSHAELVRKWASLTQRNQQLFDMYGLTHTPEQESAAPPPSQPVAVPPSFQGFLERGSSEGMDPREDEQRRREAVRRAAEAVRQAARHTAAQLNAPASAPATLPLPPSEPVPLQSLSPMQSASPMQSFSMPSVPPEPPQRTAPPISMQVPARGAPPALPLPPRLPSEMRGGGVHLPRPSAPPRRRNTTPPPPAATESGQIYQIPPPSIPPPRRPSSRPQLRVVNGS